MDALSNNIIYIKNALLLIAGITMTFIIKWLFNTINIKIYT